MGFLDGVKKILGIGGVKMSMQMDSLELKKTSGKASGKVTLTSQSDQFVNELTVYVREKYSHGRGSEKTIRTFDLGKSIISSDFEIKKGESKEFSFTCDYVQLKSDNDQLKEQKNKVMQGIGKLGSFVDAEKSEYYVCVSGSIKGVLLGPSQQVSVILV